MCRSEHLEVISRQREADPAHAAAPTDDLARYATSHRLGSPRFGQLVSLGRAWELTWPPASLARLPGRRWESAFTTKYSADSRAVLATAYQAQRTLAGARNLPEPTDRLNCMSRGPHKLCRSAGLSIVRELTCPNLSRARPRPSLEVRYRQVVLYSS